MPFRTFRDHRLSLFQAAAADTEHSDRGAPTPELERAASKIAALDLAGEPVPHQEPADVGTEAWTCARLGFKLLKAELSGDAASRSTLEEQLFGSRCDPRWTGTLLSYFRYFGPNGRRRRIPYRPPDSIGPGVIEIASDAKIALVSDWGTGRPTAMAVLRNMAQHQPDVLIHLGDIYYAGTAAECERNFRVPMDQELDRANRPSLVYTLAGNHDMYSGGEGYYGLIDRLNDGPFRQPASYFCLRSSDHRWQFLAMDTGLHAYDATESHPLTFLDAAEEDWLTARITEFEGRTILLSHHPLFSALSPIGPGGPSPYNPRLLASFRRFAASGRIAAWFWGHEHTMALYAPFAGLDRGRCLGCGAIPMFVADRPYARLPELKTAPELLEPRLADDGVVLDHGYAIVTLDAGTGIASAEYRAVGRRTGLVYAETLNDLGSLAPS